MFLGFSVCQVLFCKGTFGVHPCKSGAERGSGSDPQEDQKDGDRDFMPITREL